MTMIDHRTVWQFHTANLIVTLTVTPDFTYQYDGDDEDGETQRKLDAGDYVAFDSAVTVCLRANGALLGSDHLGGSVYAFNDASDFWEAHRGPDPMARNCSVMQAARGPNVCIGHYFPDMVRQAVREARQTLRTMQSIRLRPTA